MKELAEIKNTPEVGEWLICVEKFDDIGGMRFRQDYFIIGKKYQVELYEVYKDKAKIGIKNEHGWYTELSDDFTGKYLITEREWREQQLNKVLNQQK